MTSPSLPVSRTPAEISSVLIEQIRSMTEDWFDGEDMAIDHDTWLVGDLGFSSMDFVILVVDIQTRFDKRDFPFDALFAPQGTYVKDLSVKQIADFVAAHLDGTR